MSQSCLLLCFFLLCSFFAFRRSWAILASQLSLTCVSGDTTLTLCWFDTCLSAESNMPLPSQLSWFAFNHWALLASQLSLTCGSTDSTVSCLSVESILASQLSLTCLSDESILLTSWAGLPITAEPYLPLRWVYLHLKMKLSCPRAEPILSYSDRNWALLAFPLSLTWLIILLGEYTYFW